MIIPNMGMCTYYLIIMKHLMCSKVFISEEETQLKQRVKMLQTDQVREYLSNLFKEFCKEKGIHRQLTIPDTPQQNGVTG